MNSGPLSTRIVLGAPRLAVMRDMVSTTCSPLMPGSTSMAKGSRVKASTTVKARSLRRNPATPPGAHCIPFPQVAMEHGCGDKWGLFASYIPHRVGYQCSAAYRHIIIPRVRPRCGSAARYARSRIVARRACCATTTS